MLSSAAGSAAAMPSLDRKPLVPCVDSKLLSLSHPYNLTQPIVTLQCRCQGGVVTRSQAPTAVTCPLGMTTLGLQSPSARSCGKRCPLKM